MFGHLFMIMVLWNVIFEWICFLSSLSVWFLWLQLSQLSHCQPDPPGWSYWPTAEFKKKNEKETKKRLNKTWRCTSSPQHSSDDTLDSLHSDHKKHLYHRQSSLQRRLRSNKAKTTFMQKSMKHNNTIQKYKAGLLRTFSDVLSVSMSCFFWVKMMLKTAWERLLVSFMLVAATVLQTKKKETWSSALSLLHLLICTAFCRTQSHDPKITELSYLALFPESIRSWMSL